MLYYLFISLFLNSSIGKINWRFQGFKGDLFSIKLVRTSKKTANIHEPRNDSHGKFNENTPDSNLNLDSKGNITGVGGICTFWSRTNYCP